jgi:hypothetical protein
MLWRLHRYGHYRGGSALFWGIPQIWALHRVMSTPDGQPFPRGSAGRVRFDLLKMVGFHAHNPPIASWFSAPADIMAKREFLRPQARSQIMSLLGKGEKEPHGRWASLAPQWTPLISQSGARISNGRKPTLGRR